MSQKEKKVNVHSPKVNSEYLTTISSSNFPINQTLLSSNSKDNRNPSDIPQLKCTCKHPMSKTFQKRQLKCSCKIYKNNNINNNMNSYKSESRQSRFDQITTPSRYNRTNNYMGINEQKSFRSQSYRMDTFSCGSNISRLVCTCKHKGNNNFNTIRTNSEIKRHINLWGQNTENLQFLSAPAPLLTTQYVQNLAIIQNSKPISKMNSVVKNEISYTNKIEIEGLPQIETKEIIQEEKVEEKQEEEKVEEKQEEEKVVEKQEEEKVEEKKEEEKVEEKKEENEEIEKQEEIEKPEENEEIENEEIEKQIENEEMEKQIENEEIEKQEENEQEEKEHEEKEQEEKEEEEKEEIEKEEIEEENEEMIQEEEKHEEIPEEKEKEEKLEEVKQEEKKEEKPEEVKQEEKKEEKPEVKDEERIIVNDDYNKVNKVSYTRRIRANIIRLQPQEESEKDSSSVSDYDVLQKITKYKGEYKYKNLVNQSLEVIQRHSSRANQKINIKTPSNTSENIEKLANTNIVHFTKTYEQESKDLQSNGQDIYEVPFTPDGFVNSPDIIQDLEVPEDSPYPGEIVSKKNLEEENKDNNNQEPKNNNKNKNHTKKINMDIINTQDSPMEKQYINMKIEEGETNKVQNNHEEEKSQEQDENDEPQEEIKVNIEENSNNENEEQNNENEKESENEQDVETYEIEENMDKNENNEGDAYFYNEIELGEEKEKSEEKNEAIKQHFLESHESSEQNVEVPNDNEIADNDDDKDNIEEELGRYVEEQQNKKMQEKLENKTRKKIKVYNFAENKNLQIDENKEPNSLIVCIKSSVKVNKKNKNIEENSPERGYSSSEGLDIEPKNSVVKK